MVVVNKAVFALENWPNGSVIAIGDVSPTMRVTIFAVCNFLIYVTWCS
jgi:hypothetical protein